MRALVVSDTHGDLASLNCLAKQYQADVCLHLGDFCCYTRESVKRFPRSMLRKALAHSNLPPALKEELLQEDSETMRRWVLRCRAYGDFEHYLSGDKHFSVPVYAVPGNNEDREIMVRLLRRPIRNLTFLNESTQFAWGRFCFYGLGGNIIRRQEEAEQFGYESTCAQLKNLQRQMLSFEKFFKIQLSHLPPCENEELRSLLDSIKPVLALCGHTHHWNEQYLAPSGWECRILTLPKCRRGFAVLDFQDDGFHYTIHSTSEES